MNDDRLMIAEAVFAGQIGEHHLTSDEIDEFILLVVDAAMEKELALAEQRGLAVFGGSEEEYLH